MIKSILSIVWAQIIHINKELKKLILIFAKIMKTCFYSFCYSSILRKMNIIIEQNADNKHFFFFIFYLNLTKDMHFYLIEEMKKKKRKKREKEINSLSLWKYLRNLNLKLIDWKVNQLSTEMMIWIRHG